MCTIKLKPSIFGLAFEGLIKLKVKIQDRIESVPGIVYIFVYVCVRFLKDFLLLENILLKLTILLSLMVRNVLLGVSVL